jgi:hypothetical protein
MLSSGTMIDIFLSITDDDIRDACKKYPEEKYNFVLFSSALIDAKERIRKTFVVYDSIQGSSDRDLLGRLLDSAVQQFRGIFDSIRNYSIDSEKYSVKTQVHDQIANRTRDYFESTITRGQLDKTNQNSPANNVLDAYFLAQQLEQQGKTPPDASALSDRINTLEGRAKIIEESLGASASIEAVRNFGHYYGEEAIGQETFKYWLVLGFGSVLLLVGGIVLFSLHPGAPLFGCDTATTSNWTDPYLISHVVEKILLLSIFAFLARFGFHQYSIRMHLLTAYRQKAVLGDTFVLLLADEKMAGRRDLIMTEVIGSLATLVPDGYIRKDAPELHPLAEITRLIMSFKGKDNK